MPADRATLFFGKQEEQMDLEGILWNLEKDGKLKYTITEDYRHPVHGIGKYYEVFADDPMTYFQIGWLFAHLKKIRNANNS